MKIKDLYIKRCFDIARLGIGSTSPNPNVGCVIVYQNLIIGEGWHQQFKKTHAEVNAFESIEKKWFENIQDSTVCVSLEPCSHYGNNPPCADLIDNKKITTVNVAYSDPNPKVAGGGIKKLLANNIDVSLLNSSINAENLCKENTINPHFQTLRPFFTKILRKRPYIILKWAETADGYIGKRGQSIQISNKFSSRLVHKWRSESDGILVGTNTTLVDNPELTNRHYFGKSPIRIVLDKNIKIPPTHHVFSGTAQTLIYTTSAEKYAKHIVSDNTIIETLDFEKNSLNLLLTDLLQKDIAILFVEGGAQILKSFIKNNLWDEARVIKSPKILRGGIKAPTLPKQFLTDSTPLDDNTIDFYLNKSDNL